MNTSEMFGFSLETDDRTEAEKSRGRGKSKAVDPEDAKPPMDTDYQEEMEPSRPQIRFNLNFDKGIRGERQDEHGVCERFSIEHLFDGVASGHIRRLDGLEQYLVRTKKHLSDSLYQSYGKTPLMKALLHLKDGTNDTVEFLIGISDRTGDVHKLINASYTSHYYKGQTALHIAIERRSLSYVKLLVSKGADVHAKATGTFFQPQDRASFYFGELPLSLAACTNQPDVVDFLLMNENQAQRADPRQADSHGNTVLHALVTVGDDSAENTKFITSMYDQILKITADLHPKLRLEDLQNHQGLTPLKMAAKTGKTGLFSHILQREFHDAHIKHLSRKFTEWVYGPVHCSLYDLDSVDSYEDNSVLEILVYGSSIPKRHEMLETEPLSRLLEQKWTRFAGRFFFFNFLVYILYLMVFTIVAYNKKDKIPFPVERSTTGYLFVSGQVLLTVANVYFFIIGIIEMKRKRPKLQTLLIDGYYDILFLVQAVLFLVSGGLYVLGRPEYLGLLVLSLALSWVDLLYFSRGHRHLGIYSVMIQKMILSDILRFLLVYVVFLFGFSAAVVTLLNEPHKRNHTDPTQSPDEDCVKPTFKNISYTTLQLFKFTIGMGDMEFTNDYQYKEVFYVLLIGYIILTYILLLNMLIALMNRTVETITKESASIWKLQRAITILDMEKRLPWWLKKTLRCGVDKNLGTELGDDRRRCFRVEEVNWNKWNTILGIINEEPGQWDQNQDQEQSSPYHRPHRGRSWRVLFGDPGRVQYQSTEMEEVDQRPRVGPIGAPNPV